MKLINIGFGNMVSAGRIVAIVSPDSAPIKRLIALVLRIGVIAALIMSLVMGLFPAQILSLFSDEAGALREGVAYLRIQSLSYLFFAVSQILIYAMRSVETTRVGMMASLVTLVFNVVLNEVLIFGRLGLPAMGVAGASVATAISKLVSFSILIFPYITRRSLLRLSLGNFYPKWDILKEIISVGSSSMVRSGLAVVASIMLNDIAGN